MASKIYSAKIKVRYAETDQMGVVYYANYLIWFEVARTEYLLSQGLDYRDVEREGFFMAVVEARCVYKAPARYGDEIVVEAQAVDVKNTSFKFQYKVMRGSDRFLLAEGTTAHVLVDKAMKPKKIPEKFRNLLIL